jgi:hypothetical protein
MDIKNNDDNSKINKINKNVKKTISYDSCLSYSTSGLTYHPLLSNIILSSNDITENSVQKICPTLPYKKTNYKILDTTELKIEALITNHFHYPINSVNFLSIVYEIDNLTELYDYINNNINNLYSTTIIRILNNSWLEFNDLIIDNIDLYININELIFKKIAFDMIKIYSPDEIHNKLLNGIKKIYNKYKNKKIIFFNKIKKYL